MISTLHNRKCLFLIAFPAISLVSLLMTHNTMANTLTKLQSDLPLQIMGWKAVSEDRFFDRTTIFSYIDGGAEIYKAYDMQSCLSRRYAISGEPNIILDIFDMGTPQNAFGVFTHDTDGKVIHVGQEGRLRPGWLSFWKYRFFVSVYAEDDTDAAQKAVNALAEQVAGAIQGRSTKPGILTKLPAEGLRSESIRYLHHPILLNYHYYISDENLLGISNDTNVVLATYRLNDKNAVLMLVEYSGSDTAQKAADRFLKFYLPEATLEPDSSKTALLENGKWAAIRRQEHFLAVVLEADSRELAQNLLRNVQWP